MPLKGNENLRLDNIEHKLSVLDFKEEIGLVKIVFILEVFFPSVWVNIYHWQKWFKMATEEKNADMKIYSNHKTY